MDISILECNNLSKEYKGKKVLTDVNLKIKYGDIYALVGHNGAGKTTLMRIMTGLSKQTMGTMSLFDSNSEKELIANRKKIGTIIEIPKFYNDKTAYENLNINRMMKNIKDKNEIKRVLDLVGLDYDEARSKKAKNYSLGMKQRLGIAKALIGDPELLILDEPINGLDPIGIIEMRELLLKLNQKEKKTIMISSHILKELSLLANRFGILNKGNLIEEIDCNEFEKSNSLEYIVKVSNAIQTQKILKENLHYTDINVISENEVKIGDNVTIALLVNALSEKGIEVIEVKRCEQNIENYIINRLTDNSFLGNNERELIINGD